MNRADYNDYRGWVLPDDELGTDEGYLVEYLDGGKSNHPDHKGYISWSPKEQFENGYTEIGSVNKVPISRIDSLLDQLEYKFELVKDTTVTGCWSFLPNGFQIGYGESACVDPKEYNQELGEKYARERCEADSKNKLWQFEGYMLMQELSPI